VGNKSQLWISVKNCPDFNKGYILHLTPHHGDLKTTKIKISNQTKPIIII